MRTRWNPTNSTAILFSKSLDKQCRITLRSTKKKTLALTSSLRLFGGISRTSCFFLVCKSHLWVRVNGVLFTQSFSFFNYIFTLHYLGLLFQLWEILGLFGSFVRVLHSLSYTYTFSNYHSFVIPFQIWKEYWASQHYHNWKKRKRHRDDKNKHAQNLETPPRNMTEEMQPS